MPLSSTSVRVQLVLDVAQPAELVLAVVPPRAPGDPTSAMTMSVDGVPLAHGARTVRDHDRNVLLIVQAPAGRVDIAYAADVPPGRGEPRPVGLVDALRYLRPSRYAPSDRLGALAAAELGAVPPGPERVRAVADWVAGRLTYLVGSSSPIDGAVETLLAGQGVCRDFAHLAVGMFRALDVPARLVSVYAPGLFPMDFHAVVEVAVDGAWYVVDATRLASRPAMVRIATGMDAADTAFLTNMAGAVDLVSVDVMATCSGLLPLDDLGAMVVLD